MTIQGSQAVMIHNLRFGYKSIGNLTDKDLEDVMEYNLPEDVMGMCFTEIRGRRQTNLEKERGSHEPT